MTPLRTLLLSATVLGASVAASQAAPDVVASVKPVHSLVAAVMKGVGEPALIVEGAGSPHTYSLKPSQARRLQNADIVFWVGPEMEAFLEKPIETIGDKATAVELIDAHGLVKLPFREGGAFEAHEHHDDDHAGGEHAGHDHAGHDHEHGHGAFDAHVWLDPENAKAMIHEIEETLSAADPDNAKAYADNAAAASAGIDALIEEVGTILAPVRGKGYVVFHDAYQYFEKRFDIPAAGSITVSPEVMPGAERVSEIRARIGELGAACVFAEPQFEPKLISVVIEGTAAKSGILDPLGSSLKDGPDLYAELIRGMATSLRDCLADAS
ncbi:zinc ABC transporter substrate-binding protein ZnuA [Stappia sp.]|uniref:zinc ABC transporter substrate-binding protein ZnuA n=1 Tax=Stappia sp. TaxID=1870903 RepID=UPI003A995504